LACCNFPWTTNDLGSFIHQNSARTLYKTSKEGSKITEEVLGVSFGIKHQLVWAILLCFLSEYYNDTQITLHFVNKISSLAFLVSSLAKTLRPELQINVRGCPVVWLPCEKPLTEISSLEITKIRNGLRSSRKVINV